jgi:hypothetical protein
MVRLGDILVRNGKVLVGDIGLTVRNGMILAYMKSRYNTEVLKDIPWFVTQLCSCTLPIYLMVMFVCVCRICTD